MGSSLIGSGDIGTGIDIQGHQNVEIRNGTVRNFHGDGISSTLGGGHNHRIMNMRVHNNGGRGIHIAGRRVRIQNCTFSDNGSIGLSLFGYNCMVADNSVCGNVSDGISCTGNGHSLIGNLVATNGGHGFHLSYLGPDYRYLIDRNTVYDNTGGSLNGLPPGATWGLNAGLP